MKRAVNGLIESVPSREMAELPTGQGVFETLLVQAGTPVFFEDHWARFVAGCRWHGFEVPANPERVKHLAVHLAVENGVTMGVLRFAAWQSEGGVEWRVEVSPPRPHMARREFRVGLGPSLPPATPDRPFKHLRRQLWLEALRTVRAAGWDDALLTEPAGGVVETCVSNIFFVDRDGLHTPGLATGPLPGIMRSRVIALAGELNLKVKEGAYPLPEVQQASEIWLSNSLLGLRPVTECAGQKLALPFPVLERFRSAWQGRYGWDPVIIAPTA